MISMREMTAVLLLCTLFPFACAQYMPNEPDILVEAITSEADAGSGSGKTEWTTGWSDSPPVEPPLVLIVSKDGDGESVAEGVPYYVQWLVRDAAEVDDIVELHDLLADIMPPPARLGPDRSLRIMTGSHTHLIMVAGFDDLSPADETRADFDESEFWRCEHSEANPCERISPDGFLEYHSIPPAVFRHRYMSVFVMWSNPPTIVDDKIAPPDGPDFVNANWLFHLSDE